MWSDGFGGVRKSDALKPVYALETKPYNGVFSITTSDVTGIQAEPLGC
jgi:hypothetical protein